MININDKLHKHESSDFTREYTFTKLLKPINLKSKNRLYCCSMHVYTCAILVFTKVLLYYSFDGWLQDIIYDLRLVKIFYWAYSSSFSNVRFTPFNVSANHNAFSHNALLEIKVLSNSRRTNSKGRISPYNAMRKPTVLQYKFVYYSIQIDPVSCIENKIFLNNNTTLLSPIMFSIGYSRSYIVYRNWWTHICQLCYQLTRHHWKKFFECE